MGEIRLTGLDAQDPLAFLASLGCLAAASEQARRAGKEAPRMRFDRGVLTPILLGEFADEDGVLEVLAADLEVVGAPGKERPRDPFLMFSYGDGVRDLKPPPDVFRAAAKRWIGEGSGDDRRTIDWAAAVLTDVAEDNAGAGKPFALHFTAGQQRFLVVANELLDGAGDKPSARAVDREDLRVAVFGPWTNDRELKVFSWSPTQDRAYALRAVDPSGDQKLGTPGADWLALRGVGMLSSAPEGGRIVTGGVRGEWKTGSFSYPVWPSWLDEDAVRSLLRHPGLRGDDERESRAARVSLPRGVEVLTCRISRSEQGGYGAFSRPSRR